MAGSYGWQGQLGIDTVDPITKRFDYHREDLVNNEEFLDTNGIRGTRAHSVERVRQGNRKIAGRIEMQPNSVEWALLFPWIFGAAGTGTPTVTFALADALTSRFVTVDRNAKVFTYSTVWVNSATFKSQQGKPLALTLDLVGTDETVAASGTFPATSIDVANGPYIHTDCVMSIGGTSYAMPEIEMTVNNAIDADRFFNSQTLSTGTKPTDRGITLRTRLPYGDATAAYNTGAAGVQVIMTFTYGSAVLTMTLVKVCFPRRSPMTESKTQEIFLPMEGIAYKSGSTLELVTTQNPGP